MEIKPGIYRCPFGAGKVEVFDKDLDDTSNLGKKLAGVQSRCLESYNMYMCKCKIAEALGTLKEIKNSKKS